MKKIIYYLVFLCPCLVFSQINNHKHDYIWVLGYDVDVSTPEGQGNLYDFNGDTLEVSFLVKDMNIDFTTTSISDTAGNLLFYTNGCYIADATHDMMENGDEINYPGWTYDTHCIDGTEGYTLSQGPIILPQPDSSHIYFMFHSKKL